VERNHPSPSILVKYAGYKRHGLFLRYYSDSKGRKTWVQDLSVDIQECYQGFNAVPTLSFLLLTPKLPYSAIFEVNN